ncbi:MAG: hypothetical protein ABI843_14475 [Dokdonella sp.]
MIRVREMLKTDLLGSSTNEYAEPTPQSRRRFAVQWLVAGAILAVGLVVNHFWFAFLKSLPGCDDIPYLRATLLAWLIIPFLLGIYGLRLGRRLLVHQQWPPPDRPLFKRQRISRGRAVRWRAYGILVASVILLATPLWGGWLLGQSGIFSVPIEGSRCARSGGLAQGARPTTDARAGTMNSKETSQ